MSLDKTASAFHAAVANKDALWGGWAVFVALSGVVMADAALVVAEFALVRDKLKKGLKRQVWTVAGVWRGIKVRLGVEEPLDYNEMTDPALKFYSQFVFWLVVAANVYAVLQASAVSTVADVLNLETALFLFVGIAGALSLRFIGQQLAHIVYDLMTERRRLEQREMIEQWRQDMNELWAEEAPRILAEALHERFLQKNKLPPGAQSPYLLLEEGEEGELNAVPLAISQAPSPEPWGTYSLSETPNGNHHGNHRLSW